MTQSDSPEDIFWKPETHGYIREKESSRWGLLLKAKGYVCIRSVYVKSKRNCPQAAARVAKVLMA